jgi:superfamily II DNA or RNA helicase/predicted nucleotidyltransferase
MAEMVPQEGMMATVRNRRAIITGVESFDAVEAGRYHIVELEYTDGIGAESEKLLWEAELGTSVLEPSSLPNVFKDPQMVSHEFDAMVRSARWSAITPSLPFSGLEEDRPPLAAPLFGDLHPEAYQLVPILKALEMPRVALMLADAVGLGKTIQAGMVMRELMLRRRIRRVLILCPAALRTQWREEMDDKFCLPFEIVDRAETIRLQREIGIDANPWRTYERIIASYHYLKQADVLEQFRSVAEPREDGRLRWDLLIVDEAHNLCPSSFGKDSALSVMLQQISPWFDHRLFLTATPHNGHTRSFSGLLEALDPLRFTRKTELNQEDRKHINETVIRRLKSEINACYTSQGLAPRFSERHVEALPYLEFEPHEHDLILKFSDFRTALKQVVQTATHREQTAANFATEVLQKRLLSGPWAFGQSWLAMVDGLQKQTSDKVVSAASIEQTSKAYQEETDDDNEQESRQRHTSHTIGAWLRQWEEPLSSHIHAVSTQLDALGVTWVRPGLEPEAYQQEVAKKARAVKFDARLKTLEGLLKDQMRQANTWKTDERIVIFTEYLATLSYLEARLRALFGEGGWLLSLYGGMKDEARDRVKRQFNDPKSQARILLATDAAGEGLNLQRAARYLLHWDIPWNPARMEQRNGRLDRHGQERDVLIFHFDSKDDASVSFMGKVLRKRSQTREDRVVTDQIFAEAIIALLNAEEKDPATLENQLDKAIQHAKVINREVIEDISTATKPLPGQSDEQRLQELKQQLDLSPISLRETLETALALGVGRPRLQKDQQGRERFVHPIPHLWQDTVDQTLRSKDAERGLLAVVFDPAHYVREKNGRPIYTPEPDSRLLHLGHALIHRVLSSFAQYRFPGHKNSSSRWIVRCEDLPQGTDAQIFLTVEELAINELREPCRHRIQTYLCTVKGQSLEDPIPVLPPPPPQSSPCSQEVISAARELWDEFEDDIKKQVKSLQKKLTHALKQRLQISGAKSQQTEQKRFQIREKELTEALKDNKIDKMQKEAKALEQKIIEKPYLFAEMTREEQKKLSDLEAEIDLRKGHYESVLERLQAEKQRTLELILPKRYTLRQEARVYPIAIEIRLRGEKA